MRVVVVPDTLMSRKRVSETDTTLVISPRKTMLVVTMGARIHNLKSVSPQTGMEMGLEPLKVATLVTLPWK